MSETRTPNVFLEHESSEMRKNYFEHEKLEKSEIHLNKTFDLIKPLKRRFFAFFYVIPILYCVPWIQYHGKIKKSA